MGKLKPILFTLLIVAIVGITIYNNLNQETQQETDVEVAPRIGFKAPNFTLTTMDGSEITLWEIEKPVVINFWGSWCEPCQIEAPEIQAAYEQYQDRVEILAVNTSDPNPEQAQEFVNMFNYTMPVPMDTEMAVFKQYRINGLPTTLLLDKNGVIQDLWLGILQEGELTKRIGKLAEEGR
ncbi:TlpA family protein disulfide reductase [Rubeoparvulum massiliense]|uniref:TlpA family protein disulfide reductase n=1 Tax=Rubeoparvulum massiliense TaxID=1631346 RepID=UPI00065DDA1D|nr:redoxin domain-containing protein [Rubeoparvulum massiliense]